MQFNLKLMREFFKFFRVSEEEAHVDQSDKINTKEVGEINVVTPTKRFTFSLAVTDNLGNGEESAALMKTVQGEMIVTFHIDYFIRQIYSHNLNGLYAVVAHEIGHYLSGHFERDADASVDIKKEVQTFFYQRHKANPTLANEIAYLRSVFFALLKGGVIVREWEADMEALRFVPIADLVHIHSQDFSKRKNIFTVVEKVNRIRRLNEYVQVNDIGSEGYSLFIQLYETKENKQGDQPLEK